MLLSRVQKRGLECGMEDTALQQRSEGGLLGVCKEGYFELVCGDGMVSFPVVAAVVPDTPCSRAGDLDSSGVEWWGGRQRAPSNTE